ncbi:hypothetical protein K505DRAFT_88647 [Melanomma pulvis-pyrius CBS 109.77]|uniref:Uncharacterized protein n=1 Tax=Melanomma pulvis-pyrius CBS 109.77 TaxID=1314802 RepID=A0A6A6X027_9PLEO|nr:hypothetical protein K505DRAFT_88647 [Melanomma pulvis-pyrius CBS 109.77]
MCCKRHSLPPHSHGRVPASAHLLALVCREVPAHPDVPISRHSQYTLAHHSSRPLSAHANARNAMHTHRQSLGTSKLLELGDAMYQINRSHWTPGKEKVSKGYLARRPLLHWNEKKGPK